MTIDVFADIACPWCYIGEHRLFAALAQRPHLDVQPRWRPFQLQPQLPATGLPWRSFVEQKFGGWEQAQAGFRRVATAAKDDGIAFDFDHIVSAANTTDAHRLILFGRQLGREWEMVDALFRAYFAEGRDLNEGGTLLAITDAAGLDREAAAAYLASDAGRDEVSQSQAFAQQLGINGVPFTVLDGRLGLSGAQSIETFVRALDEAARSEATEHAAS